MQSYSMSFVGDTFAVCGAILVIFTFPGLEQFEQVVVGTIELQQQNLEQVQLFLELANSSSFFHSKEQFEQVAVDTIELQLLILEQYQLFLELEDFSSFFH